MIRNKKQFLLGLNGDDAPQVLENEQMLNLMNGRVAISEYGRDLRLENIAGTTQISQSVVPPYGFNQCIGSVYDAERNRVIYFLYNTFGDHGIYCYDISSGTTYAVIYDSQVTDGLNFSKTYRINRETCIIGDLLMWTDNNNEPKKLNIEAGIKANHASYDTDVPAYALPLKYTTTTLIKRPPIYRIEAEKASDVDFDNNFIKNNAYQFTYRYYYRDNEYSALAAFSELMPYNYNTETSNYIEVTIPLSEYIDDDILVVEVCARYGNTGNIAVVKKWDKDNDDDLEAINLHNAGTTALNFNFYDDQQGEILDSVTSVTSFHGVPLTAKTIQSAKNRVFFGNILSGYNSPETSSLAATVTETDTGGGEFEGTWGYITLHANYTLPVQDTYMFPFVKRTSDNTLYYFSSVRNSNVWNGGLGSVPSTIQLYEATQVAVTEAQLVTYLKNVYYPDTSSSPVGTPTWETAYEISYDSLGAVTVIEFSPTAQQQYFKTGSRYEVAIAFYDRFRRKCGVVRNNAFAEIGERTYSQTTFQSAISWTLSNTNALAEIPDWAYYYQIHVTKSLTTRFFIQGFASNMTYVTKDQDGTYTYGVTTYSEDTSYAIGVELKKLNACGIGYTYTEGDYIKLYVSGQDPELLTVLGVDGNYLLCRPVDVGTLNSSTNCIFEVFTPYRASTTEPFYESGEVYDISNPTTASRAYTTLVGTLEGDTYIIERAADTSNTFLAECMSPNDNFWQIWDTDTGWTNFEVKRGQTQKEKSIVFSDTYINGTYTNGTNIFQPLNQETLPNNCGEIQKLQVATKVVEEGDIMLAICRNQTVSIYLGETQVVGASSNAFLAQSTSVIGTINVLKGSFGTINPESVIEYLGNVFWLDVLNGAVVQYSSNGLFDVSTFKMKRFFQRYSKDYLAASTGNLDNINGFHHIPSAIDPFYKEFLITTPALIYSNYASTLPSYSAVPSYATSIINRFDIYDQLGKTMAFRFGENKWGSNYEFMGEWYEYGQNIMFGFKNGVLYTHNTDITNWNRFYGTQYPVRLCFVQNLPDSGIKDMYELSVEGSVEPNYTVLYSPEPNVQITDLQKTDTESDYTDQEGVFYAPFFRDRLSPNVGNSATVIDKMYEGDVMKSEIPMIMMEWQAYDALMYLNAVNLGFSISRGQKQIVQQ